MRALLISAVSAVMSGLLAGHGAARSPSASFDCARASAPDEHAICNNTDLAQKDGNLGANYKIILPLLHGEDRQKFIESQRRWLRKRAECGSHVSCLEALYDRRAKELDKMLSSAQGSAALALFRKTGQCMDCDLSGADLSGIEPAKTGDDGLMQCTFDAKANGTFDGARIDNSDFITCDTKYPSALSSMSWDGASLKKTDFSGSNLGGNSFKKADLTGADLSGANLYWVDMSGATLKQANLSGAKSEPDAMNRLCSDFTNADFSQADLKDADLCGSYQNADFTGANLRGANISGHVAGLSKRDQNAQEGIEPDPADAEKPSSGDGRFKGRINLTEANLAGATLFSETKLTPGGYRFAILCRTTMPDGAVSNRDCK